MGVHAAVHGRGHDYRHGSGQAGGRDGIAGQAIGHGAEPVGRGRGHDYGLDIVGGGNVADAPVAPERQNVRVDRVAAECLERERADELDRGSRHQHSNVGPFVLEHAQEIHGLVRRDRTGDAQGDATVAEPSA